MRLLLLISWPYVRKHLLRYALLVTGVALGVGVAVALQGGSRSMLDEFRRMVEQIAGSCQLQVSAGEAGVPQTLVEKLQDLPQVRAASPVIEALTEIDQAGGRLLIIGLDMTGDAQMRPWAVGTGGQSAEVDPITFLAQPDSLLLSRAFAARHGWSIGSKLRLRSMAGPVAFSVRGLLADDRLDLIFGGNVAVMDIYGARHVFGRGETVDRIDIVLADDCPLAEGRDAIRRAAGPGYTVDPPSARGQQFEDLLNAYQSLEILACLFTVGLGICMIDAAFRLAVTQRRAEIGIVRCLGGTRRQVQAVFLLEGLVTGMVGSVLGLLLGMGFFRLVARTSEGLFRGAFGGLTEQTYQFQMSAPTVALAFLMGVGISVLASWLPSRAAAAANPVETFRPMYFQQGLEAWRPRALAISGLLACTAFIGAWQQRSPGLFYASMVMLFLAAVAAIPSIVLAIVHPLRPLFARLFRIEGALALDSLARAPRRTVTTIAVLALVFAQAVMIGGINRSSHQTLEDWIRGAFHADLLLSSSANIASRSFRFPAELEHTLRAVPGIASVEPFRSVHVPYHDGQILLIACDSSAASDGVNISETMALREGLRAGGAIELAAPAGTLRLPVRRVVNDHSDKRGVVFLPLALYRRYWNDTTVDKYFLGVAPGAGLETVRANLRRGLGDRYPASLLTRDEVREFVFHPRGRRITPFDMQLIICITVSALALMNMASVSMAERGREFALLRSVGGYRRQVRNTLSIELLVTGGIALLVGLLLGAVLLVYLLAAVERYVTGVHMQYCFPWSASLWLGGVALAAGALAVLSAMPAMARIPLSVALDSE